MRAAPERILGAEPGTAFLAVLTCALFAVTMGLLAGSVALALITVPLMAFGILATSRLLPSRSVPTPRREAPPRRVLSDDTSPSPR
ncbi:uncharacterized protein (DUF58 family) [Nocardia transvalensis]|uniref:Uncharacterized protein (DUF58 family) n=1 Tax=Nocardia transvalensis TaxID=37333 RepID=A0A7W9PK11_9NOCA|nr:hypothetical protein [Nocardia transvalensis]MBB5917395.1 uncharacterized protein (DUF58 family) [Nocardia transvalensis]